jgi:WD40 repeat protein/tRNA A-37 threonylcarbamoyl transferase component Bud32
MIMSDAKSRQREPAQLEPSLDPTLPAASGSSSATAGSLAARLGPVERERYVVAGEFARGGLGRIMRARDVRLDRAVALKELLHTDTSAEARFAAEALITARLQHPAIVPIYEAGRWPSGEPFYAMKLVSGRSLADLIAHTPTLEERLGLLPHLLAVAEAVAYAHGERIIHRDLKPANVLVGEFGETVVIDWGLAKDLSLDPGPASPALALPDTQPLGPGALTVVGSVVGTPAYMPPEQAAGQMVDERADVYALGAMLYHLLAGAAPYEGTSASEVLQQVMQLAPRPLAERQRGVPKELLALVSKAMARDPAQRYRSARELAEDLRRFQTGQLVGAYSYGLLERVRRFLRRHWVVLSVIATAVVLLVSQGAVGMRRIVQERNRADERANALTLMQASMAVSRDPNEAIAWLRSLPPSFARASAVRTIAADARAHGLARMLQGHSKSIWDLHFTPEGQQLITSSDDGTLRVWDLEHGGSRVLSGHKDSVWQMALVGRRAVSASEDGSLRVWDLDTGIGRTLWSQELPLLGMAVLEGGARVATADVEGELRVWDLGTGVEVRTQRLERGRFTRLASSADGKQLGAFSAGEPVGRLWDLEQGTQRVLEGHQGRLLHMEFSPGGELVATASLDESVRLWDPRTGQGRVLGEHLGLISALGFSPDGQRVAVASADTGLWLWQVSGGQPQHWQVHEGHVEAIAFSPDGRWLASGGYDHKVELRELASGRVQIFLGPSSNVRRLRFSPDGRQLAVATSDGSVRLLAVTEPLHRVFEIPRDFDRRSGPGPGSSPNGMALSPDGQKLAVGGADGRVSLWELSTGSMRLLELAPVEGQRADMLVAFSPQGRYLAAAGDRGQVRLWNGQGELVANLQGHISQVTALAFSPEGRYLATADRQGEIRLWELGSTQARVLPSHGRAISSLGFSPDGRYLASSAQADPTVWLWEVETGKARALADGQPPVLALAFSPDGRLLVTGSVDHMLHVWDMQGTLLRRIDAGSSPVHQVIFSPDGRRLFTANVQDNTVRTWEADTGQAGAVFSGQKGEVFNIALSADGRRMALAGSGKHVLLFDVQGGESRMLQGHTAAVLQVAFTPDGKHLLSLGVDGTVRLWPDDLPEDPQALKAWLESVDVPPLDRRLVDDRADVGMDM